MLKHVTLVKFAIGIGLLVALLYSLPTFAQPLRVNPWAYSPEQHKSAGQRPWGQTPPSSRPGKRSENNNQRPRQNSQPCQSNQYYTPYSNGGGGAGYPGYWNPYLNLPYGLPGGGWMNPVFTIDPYMGY